MLEAQPLHSVGELDIDAEIVGIELELVAFVQPALLVDVHGQRRDSPSSASFQCRYRAGSVREIDARKDRSRACDCPLPWRVPFSLERGVKSGLLEHAL
jgi:hypothetical protein